VVQLEAVNRTRVSQEGNIENAQKRMKAIVTRRKLIDLARAQTDEIEILRQELDRIRQRTFPSFTHSRRAELSRMGNPDELYWIMDDNFCSTDETFRMNCLLTS